ncbi:hypothetical protein EG329_013282 [Mollisiaceae sp. DMI_Dod_QoI]|nr:hypothetical protein EG329_013282 [Helotiales sp. DMI_Dod_QoI]
MPVPFGFGFGDIIAGIGLATKIFASLRDGCGAAAEYQNAEKDLKVIGQLVKECEVLFSDGLLGEQSSNIRQQVETCLEIAKDFQQGLERYDKDLGVAARQGWRYGSRKKIQWAVFQPLLELQKKLKDQLSLLGSSISVIHLQETRTIRDQGSQIQSRIDSVVLPQLHRVSQIGSSVSEIRTWMQNDDYERRRQEALKWLSPLAGVFDAKQHDIFDAKDRQDGLGRWLIETPEFKNWVTSNGEVLCCFGEQGVGKTVLASIIINHLKKETSEDLDIGLASNYLQGRIQSERLQKVLSNAQPINDTIIDTIVSKAQGMFLLASLQMDTLITKTNLRSLKEAMNTLPEKLHDAYDGAMARISGQESDSFDDALKILYWINYASMPLTVEQIQYALATRPGDRSLDCEGIMDEDRLIAVCCGLVNIQREGRIITLRHDSVREYFERNGEKQFPHALTDIAKTCLTYLSFDTFAQGICDSDEEIARRIRDFPLLACVPNYLENKPGRSLDGDAKKLAKPPGDERQRHQRFNESQDELGAVHRLWLASYLGLTKSVESMLDPEVVLMTTGYGETALHPAARCGRFEVIALLVKAGADINADANGMTALHDAVSNGNEGFVKFLLEKGADIEAKEIDYGWNALHYAVRDGNEGIIKVLLQRGANIEARDACERTALRHAARYGHEGLIRVLLDRGANIEARDVNQCTPLHLAVDNRHEGVIRVLLKAGADTEGRTAQSGSTALHRASQKGHQESVEALLGNGASIEIKDDNDWTALHTAAYYGHEGVIKALLKRGANIEVKTALSMATALHKASLHGQHRIVELLLDSGADIEAKDVEGWTALHFAAHYGWDAALKVLIDRGADIEAAFKGKTALYIAIEEGHESIVKFLLQKGADVEESFDVGHNPRPLDLAVEKRHLGIVRLLIDHGPDSLNALIIAAEDGKEEILGILLLNTALLRSLIADNQVLVYVAERGHERVLHMLLQAGANPNVMYKDMHILFRSMRTRAEGITGLLIEGGADTSVTHCGCSVVDFAMKYGLYEIAKMVDEANASNINAEEHDRSGAEEMMTHLEPLVLRNSEDVEQRQAEMVELPKTPEGVCSS